MMYRILLDTNTSKWIIQISGYFIFWKTLRRRTDNQEAEQFDNFDEAMAFVQKTGIERVYQYAGPDHHAPSIARA